jgi:hypothetical protein
MKNKLLFFFLFLQYSFLSAQTLTINTVEVCAAQEVLLPVTSSSLLNIGALTLYIGFDTTNLSFVSIENVDPQLSGMSTNMMAAPSQIAFAWSSTSAINFTDGKMFDLKFSSTGQTAQVFYNPGCEIADPNGATISVTYTNGLVNDGLPVISAQSNDTSVTEGGHAMFSVSSANAIAYFWKESQDNGTSWLTLEDDATYSGTHTNNLSISPVPLSFNNNQYQCVLSGENCQAITAPVKLSVGTLTSSGNVPDPCKKFIQISPVPFTDHTTIEFTLPENGSAYIQVLDCLGRSVDEITLPALLKGYHHIALSTSDWHPGVYFIKIMLIHANEQSPQLIKVIKNT